MSSNIDIGIIKQLAGKNRGRGRKPIAVHGNRLGSMARTHPAYKTRGLRMASAVSTFLMFDGFAEEAMNFYVSLFKGSEILRVERFGPGEQGKEGSIKKASFRLAGHDLISFDSPIKHAFTFTPSISLFVDCENEAELDEAFEQLSTGGTVLMPPNNYGFSTKFAWANDRFGVSWQLNLR
jgi:predicted 3-demethylubiquinone-9 3-methyltransferase (glyoxalase superfamily)